MSQESYLLNIRVFPRRLRSGGIFNNKQLSSPLFSGNLFCGNKALIEGDKVVMGVSPLGKTLNTKIVNLHRDWMGCITHARHLVQNKLNRILHRLLKTHSTWGGEGDFAPILIRLHLIVEA